MSEPSEARPGGAEPQMSDEELRAAYEEELKRVTVADVVIQTVVSLINLSGRKLGISEGTRDERDLAQARDGIDAVRALMPVVERAGGVNLEPLRDALSQLQLAYAREAGAAAAGSGGEGEQAPDKPADEKQQEQQPGPAQASGRLWVPGQ
jgi:hypothetical protein